MTYKENALKLLHKFYKKDEWIGAFLDCVQSKINDINTILDRIANLSHFNRLDAEGCKWWSNLLRTVLPASMSLADKQAYIRAKWRASGHNSITLIKNICNSWENGQVDAELDTDEDDNLIGHCYHSDKEPYEDESNEVTEDEAMDIVESYTYKKLEFTAF